MARRLFAVLTFALTCGATSARAQEVVPPPLQAAIFTKMLEYDRALKARAGDEVKIGIVFRSEDKGSAQTEADIRKAFSSLGTRTVQGLPLKVASHPYRDAAGLGAWVAREKVGILYLAPPLAGELEAIRALAREKKLVTMSPLRKDVESGVALGMLVRGENPRILVNLPVAQAVGMDLDPKLLQLSEVLR